MNALIQTYPLPFALILALLAALIVLLAVNARLRKMQRALRGRIIESERTITAQQTQLNETVNSVLQMSVSSAQSSEARTQQLADRLEARLSGIAESNERRLDDMRRLIDEQLSGTLEKRLGQSFQQVSRQLEQVYKGLGEMQTLAGGVGDLKKVLTGVKTRGVWGEIQLGRLLGDTLTEGQYLENTPVVPGSSERVEFAVRLPGRDGAGLLLPIDSKFPLDAFRHLIDESETGDKARADKAALLLQRAVLDQAKKISEKYVKPPYTTDFALMFLPIESLYAEVMRRESLNEEARALSCGDRRAIDALGALKQPVAGLPHAVHRAAHRRGVAAAGHATRRVSALWRYARADAPAARSGHGRAGHRHRPQPRHYAPLKRAGGFFAREGRRGTIDDGLRTVRAHDFSARYFDRRPARGVRG